MGLSNDLISQFVKITKDTAKKESSSYLYGTAKVDSDGSKWVQLDGSELFTPAITTINVADGDRVAVSIVNHTATITGNLTHPSVNTENLDQTKIELEEKMDKLEIGEIVVGDLTAIKADIETLKTGKLDADLANITKAAIETLSAKYADIDFANISEAAIETLNAKYANVDFGNIGELAIQNFFSKSGIIDDLVVGDGHVTGKLIGVEIIADSITSGTLKAERLILQGDDGLFHEINVSAGGITEGETVPDDGILGSVIVAKSITAEQIRVDDLIAFDAAIGGFSIGSNSLYSGVKESIDNTTRGIYMDTDGQVYFGDADNYIRYYKDVDENGNEKYKLAISAESLMFGANSKSSVEDLRKLTEHVKIGVYTDPDTGDAKPSVELAEGDSGYKQVITNTDTMYMDGDDVKTRINTDGIDTNNLRVDGEFKQVEWTWARRANGNYGLTYKEATE